MKHGNDLGQAVGAPVEGWVTRPWPPRAAMIGRFCRVEPLSELHAVDLYAANGLDVDGRNWTYLGVGPFIDLEGYRAWVASVVPGEDPLFHAIIDVATGKAVGVATFMRIEPKHGVIEVGHLNFSPALQRTPAATEAMFLMMRRAFDELGYRRYEWKCDSLNAPSRRAAERLGFVYEGTFRQAMIYKGLSRDTAWFSIIDSEWPALKAAYESWLAPGNFDSSGQQRHSLGSLMAGARANPSSP